MQRYLNLTLDTREVPCPQHSGLRWGAELSFIWLFHQHQNVSDSLNKLAHCALRNWWWDAQIKRSLQEEWIYVLCDFSELLQCLHALQVSRRRLDLGVHVKQVEPQSLLEVEHSRGWCLVECALHTEGGRQILKGLKLAGDKYPPTWHISLAEGQVIYPRSSFTGWVERNGVLFGMLSWSLSRKPEVSHDFRLQIKLIRGETSRGRPRAQGCRVGKIWDLCDVGLESLSSVTLSSAL